MRIFKITVALLLSITVLSMLALASCRFSKEKERDYSESASETTVGFEDASTTGNSKSENTSSREQVTKKPPKSSKNTTGSSKASESTTVTVNTGKSSTSSVAPDPEPDVSVPTIPQTDDHSPIELDEIDF